MQKIVYVDGLDPHQDVRSLSGKIVGEDEWFVTMKAYNKLFKVNKKKIIKIIEDDEDGQNRTF